MNRHNGLMRNTRTNNCCFVIREIDSFRKGIIEEIIIFLFLLCITPWFLRIRRLSLFWFYGLLAIGLVLNIIYYFQIKRTAKEILFLIDIEGIKIRDDKYAWSLLWEEIESVAIRCKKVPYRKNQKKWVFIFYVKTKNQKEICAEFREYVVFMPIAISRIKRAVKECSNNVVCLSCSIPILRQIFY